MNKNESESPTKNIFLDLEDVCRNYFDLNENEIKLLVPSVVLIMEALSNMLSVERKCLEKELSRWTDDGGANVAQ